MAITDIKEIRLLPPLAVGRLGSSNEPMHNYTAEVPPDDPKGFRQLRPAETLVIDPANGTVVGAVTPAALSFRDGAGLIKPVAPFIEVWARFTDDGPLEPLTSTALGELGLTPGAVHWEVTVGNLKVFRRTGDPGDRVVARLTAADLAGHARQDLRGRADNFRATRTISLGSAQYIRPTEQFPEVRFRFTPAHGLVFGHRASAVIPAARAVYDPVAGDWDNHRDRDMPNSPTPRARLTTAPGDIYARSRRGVNLGYLDDSCDGIVRVSIQVGGRELTSLARITAGPPDFAPDSFPVRSLADDLEQMIHGPDVDTVTADQVIDIIRRAVETMRLMNTETQNRSFPFWVEEAQQAFENGAPYAGTRGLHEGLLTAVALGLNAAPTSAERKAAVDVLQLIVGILRAPEAVADYSKTAPAEQRPAMQRMPALMRGSDGHLLAVTRRQRSILTKAIEQFRAAPPVDATAKGAMVRLIQKLMVFAGMHSGVTIPSGATLDTLFADAERLLAHLSTAVAAGDVADGLGLKGQRLVVPRNPDQSAFFRMITSPGHPMRSRFANYRDDTTGANGVDVVRTWIMSLS